MDNKAPTSNRVDRLKKRLKALHDHPSNSRSDASGPVLLYGAFQPSKTEYGQKKDPRVTKAKVSSYFDAPVMDKFIDELSREFTENNAYLRLPLDHFGNSGLDNGRVLSFYRTHQNRLGLIGMIPEGPSADHAWTVMQTNIAQGNPPWGLSSVVNFAYVPAGPGTPAKPLAHWMPEVALVDDPGHGMFDSYVRYATRNSDDFLRNFIRYYDKEVAYMARNDVKKLELERRRLSMFDARTTFGSSTMSPVGADSPLVLYSINGATEVAKEATIDAESMLTDIINSKAVPEEYMLDTGADILPQPQQHQPVALSTVSVVSLDSTTLDAATTDQPMQLETSVVAAQLEPVAPADDAAAASAGQPTPSDALQTIEVTAQEKENLFGNQQDFSISDASSATNKSEPLASGDIFAQNQIALELQSHSDTVQTQVSDVDNLSVMSGEMSTGFESADGMNQAPVDAMDAGGQQTFDAGLSVEQSAAGARESDNMQVDNPQSQDVVIDASQNGLSDNGSSEPASLLEARITPAANPIMAQARLAQIGQQQQQQTTTLVQPASYDDDMQGGGSRNAKRGASEMTAIEEPTSDDSMVVDSGNNSDSHGNQVSISVEEYNQLLALRNKVGPAVAEVSELEQAAAALQQEVAQREKLLAELDAYQGDAVIEKHRSAITAALQSADPATVMRGKELQAIAVRAAASARKGAAVPAQATRKQVPAPAASAPAPARRPATAAAAPPAQPQRPQQLQAAARGPAARSQQPQTSPASSGPRNAYGHPVSQRPAPPAAAPLPQHGYPAHLYSSPAHYLPKNSQRQVEPSPQEYLPSQPDLESQIQDELEQASQRLNERFSGSSNVRAVAAASSRGGARQADDNMAVYKRLGFASVQRVDADQYARMHYQVVAAASSSGGAHYNPFSTVGTGFSAPASPFLIDNKSHLELLSHFLTPEKIFAVGSEQMAIDEQVKLRERARNNEFPDPRGLLRRGVGQSEEQYMSSVESMYSKSLDAKNVNAGQSLLMKNSNQIMMRDGVFAPHLVDLVESADFAHIQHLAEAVLDSYPTRTLKIN